MRNVTIVESNVEPNKEHLWFYNGRLKWFGPNGWEEIYSQALSPTTTPKPVAPSTTTSTPRPEYSIRFTNKTNVYITFSNIYYGTENATTSPLIQPEQTCVLKYRDEPASVAEANLVSFNSLKITAIRNGEIVQEYVPYEIHAHDVGHSHYTFSFKGLLDNGVTDVLIQNEVPSTTTTTTTTTTTSTPGPGVMTTPFGVRINSTIADKVNITATTSVAEPVSKSIEPNGTTYFEILPNSGGGIFSLRVQSVNLHDVVDAIAVTILGKMGGDTINQNIIIDNGTCCTIEYSASAALSSIGLDIHLYKYDATSSTTPTQQPGTTTTSSTTTRPPNGSGREIEVYTGHGITYPLSTLMTSKDTLYDGLIDMEDKFYPLDEYNKMYYSTSGKYLAVVHSTEAKDTIVASISSGLGKHTLYPKETAISGNTGHRFFLFDLSESPDLESTYGMSPTYIELSAYTPDTISTIAPFIDGNIPPFADEE